MSRRVLRKSPQLRAALLQPQQRVQANRVRRNQLVQLEDGWFFRRARREKIRHVRLGEASSEVYERFPVLASSLDPAKHVAG